MSEKNYLLVLYFKKCIMVLFPSLLLGFKWYNGAIECFPYVSGFFLQNIGISVKISKLRT